MEGHSCQQTQSRRPSIGCLHPPQAPASPSVKSHPERPFKSSLSWLLLYAWQYVVQLKANHGKQWLSPFTVLTQRETGFNRKVPALRTFSLVGKATYSTREWMSEMTVASDLHECHRSQSWVRKAARAGQTRTHRFPQGSQTWGREVHRTAGHQSRLRWGEEKGGHLQGTRSLCTSGRSTHRLTFL